ncbi:MAG: DUF167 domain-containing protein [Candidatus Thorarchaeota archaeon]|nr:DUF167 domain-containing protein [Candidatus Thorarchaeota archaeon]
MTPKAVEDREKGCVINVVVRPGSKARTLIAEVNDEAIHINLQAQAKDGKANAELVKRLAKTLGVQSSRITILTGHKSRDKTLFISGVASAEALSALRSAVNV